MAAQFPHEMKWAFLSGGGVTDGTTNQQTIVAMTSGFVRPVPANAALRVEPSEAIKVGAPTIDSITRLIFWAERTGAAGNTWTYRLNMSRKGVVGTSVPVITNGRVEGPPSGFDEDSIPIVTETAFAHDFMKTEAFAPFTTDVLQFEWLVTPDAPQVESVWFFGIMLPASSGANVAFGGRGHMVGTSIVR